MADSSGRLAVFLPGLYGGGGERTMLSLSGGLAAAGHEVDLVLAKSEGPYLDQVPPTVRLVELNAWKTVTSLPSLARYLRRERPVAMLSALSRANVVAAWARRLTGRPPRLVVNEQNTVSVWARNASDWGKRLVPRLARAFYPWTNAVVGVSRGVADDLVEAVGLPADLVHVIFNPGITADMRERAKERSDHPWFAEGEPPVILAVGALIPQKDYPNLLRAMARVRAERPARLIILGEGRERPSLEALVRELDLEDDVALPGFVRNPYAFMSRADVFALSSRWEGLPTVLVEALYCRARLVATDCPSGPREILDGGRHGRLVPTERDDLLAEGLLAALAGGASSGRRLAALRARDGRGAVPRPPARPCAIGSGRRLSARLSGRARRRPRSGGRPEACSFATAGLGPAGARPRARSRPSPARSRPPSRPGDR